MIVAWGAVGAGLGVLLEFLARRLSGETSPACPGCGTSEQGPSWLALLRALGRSRPPCRGCGSWALSWLAGLTPLSAMLFAVLASRWPLGPTLVTLSLYAAVLLLVAVVDLRHRLVYPQLTYPVSAVAIVLTPMVLDLPAWSSLLGALAGGGVFLLIFLAARAAYGRSDALGFGDVMIAGLIGSMVGFPEVSSALLLGALFGGLGAALVGLIQRSRRAHFAYGPALCLGGLISLLRAPVL
jgi:prepilin signal peptidase PulO-like enzyme (type II secretory pathway)